MSELTPHRFRDGYYRVRRPGDEISCLYVSNLRELCRYTHKGYRLAMSPKHGATFPEYIEPERIRIGIGRLGNLSITAAHSPKGEDTQPKATTTENEDE